MTRRQNWILYTAVLFLVSAAVVFYFYRVVIPGERLITEKRVRMEIDERAMAKKKVAVIDSDEGLAQYTRLTDEIIAKKIRLMEIPERYCARGVVTDLESLRNKVTKREFTRNEQVIIEDLSTEKKWFGDFDRKKEYEVKSIVAGELKAGNIVDLVVSYENGDYDVVIPKTKILKVINPFEVVEPQTKTSSQQNSPIQPTTIQQPSNKATPYTIVVAPRDEDEYRDMELAKKVGKLEPRLYVDESQPPSKKTFDYSIQVKKSNLKEISEKIKLGSESR